jgi:signal transduction histidine kinase
VTSEIQKAPGRARWWLAVVFALAVLAMATNEIVYQHSHSDLTRAVDLTEARLEASSTLQTLTDAEFSARRYMADRSEEDLAAFRTAMAALTLSQDAMLRFMSRVDPQEGIDAAKLKTSIDARIATLNSWMAPGVAAPLPLPSSEGSRSQLRAVRAGFDRSLQRAASLQQDAIKSSFSAMMFNRVLLHALMLLLMAALLLRSRQLRRRDQQTTAATEALATEVRERTAELRQLAEHLENAREDERGHVARELHDDLGGLLTSMKLEMARLRRVPALPDAALERMASIERRLNDGIALKRRIIEDLRPSSLDQLGLCVALEMLCIDASSNLGIPIVARLQPVALNKDAELTIYRVVQESITNISKYARATEVQVTLEPAGDHVRVNVQDDGQGFDVHRVGTGHHGLLGMRVRLEAHAGKLTVRSVMGEGTSVCAELPTSTKGAQVAAV